MWAIQELLDWVNNIEVTDAVADDQGILIGEDNAYAQTKIAIQKIEKAIIELGGSLNDIVRTRLFVTNIDN